MCGPLSCAWKPSSEHILQHGLVFGEDISIDASQTLFFSVVDDVLHQPYVALFLRENSRREQNHVDEGNERHRDIVCRQVQ